MMRNMIQPELEAPEKQYVITGAIYSIACFFSLPFVFALFSGGLHDNVKALSWFEIVFHVLNFIVVVSLFREYLSDSLLNMQLNKEQVITFVAITAGLLLGIGLLWHFAYLFTGNELLVLAAFGTIPLSEMDILMLSCDVVYGAPLFGTICMVVLVPVITSCLYYAIGFAPFFNIRPWLGYLTLCFAVFFPRFCNIFSGWDTATELVLYAAQLPVHLISAWGYRKTNTLWTPIIAQMIANLAGCLLMIIFYGI